MEFSLSALALLFLVFGFGPLAVCLPRLPFAILEAEMWRKGKDFSSDVNGNWHAQFYAIHYLHNF